MSILGAFQAAQRSANVANLQRYKQGLGLYDQMITNWGKGGGFVKGAEATLERTKKRDVAGGMQNLVSSGLAGTTMAAGIGKKWEEEVGAPSRLSIADIAGQRLAQAMEGKAGFIERRQDTGPDPGMVSSLMQGMGNQPQSTSWGQYKPHPAATKMVTKQPTSTGTVYGSAAKKKATTSYKAPTGTQVGSSYYGAAYGKQSKPAVKPKSLLQIAASKFGSAFSPWTL